MQECHCLWHFCTKSKCTKFHRGSKQQAIHKLLYKQSWIEPTVQFTWGNRTCMCMDSWQHQTQTTKPWVWPQSHQHGWSAVQWRGCLSKITLKTLYILGLLKMGILKKNSGIRGEKMFAQLPCLGLRIGNGSPNFQKKYMNVNQTIQAKRSLCRCTRNTAATYIIMNF